MIQRVSFTSIVFNVQCLSTLFPYFAYCAPPTPPRNGQKLLKRLPKRRIRKQNQHHKIKLFYLQVK